MKLLLIGDAQVGKTSLVERFCADQYTDVRAPEAGLEFKLANVILDDKRVKLQIVSVLSCFRFFSSHFASSGISTVTS